MQYFLKTAGYKTVNEFREAMLNYDVLANYGGIPTPLGRFIDEPKVTAEEILGFIIKTPNELVRKVNGWLTRIEGTLLSEETNEDRLAAINGVRRVGARLDEFTRWIANARHWGPIYNGPMKVTRVWRTKADVIVGSPEERNLPIDQVPNRLSSLVAAENDDGTNKKFMISVSTGTYRDGGDPEGPLREDFLIDLPEMYEHGSKVRMAGRHRGCSRDTGIALFSEMVNESMAVFDAILDLAEPLERQGVLNDKRFLFKKPEVIVKAEFKAENNPNAKYEIGGWA
jgi:hypothetical protein